jgi:beta-carotene hydroxylase
MHDLDDASFPPLGELGLDLWVVTPWRRAWYLAGPFLAAALYALFAMNGRWVPAVGAVVWLSWLTYGSISHDLVHGTLGLSPRWNRVFLHAMERLMLRSGHAYQIAHLRHHRIFPSPDDVEGRLVHLPFWRFVLVTPLQQARVWWWAWRQPESDKTALAIDAVWAVAFLAAGVWLRATAPQILAYAVLVIAGSWAIPFVTVLLPHRREGHSSVTFTRWFRGRFFSIVFFDHLYHVEHHLYPSVPHHHWKRLADRVAPHLRARGLTPIDAPRLFW